MILLVSDPYNGAPDHIEVFDGFDDSVISTLLWAPKVEVGNTAITETGGVLKFANPGTGTLGRSFLKSLRAFPRHIRISVDIQLVDGSEAADGDHAESYLELYLDANNYIRYGQYRDTSDVVNSVAYLRVMSAGVLDEIAVNVAACDAVNHTYTLVLLENTIMVYFDSILYTSFEWSSLLNYYITLGSATQNNTDKIDARFDCLEVQQGFDFAIMNIGINTHYILDVLNSSPIITDHDYTMLDDHVDLADASALGLEFLTANFGRVFRLSAVFNITGARIDYCRVYDASLTSFIDQDSEAIDLADGNVPIVPIVGPGVDDYVAFGLSEATKRLDIVMGPGGKSNVANTFAWRKMDGAGSQVAFTALTDGTTGFTTDGSVTWTDNLVLDTINGITAYWVIAKVTAAGAATDVPIGSHMQFSPAALVDFDSLGVFNTFLIMSIYRKIGGSYRQQPSDIMYFQQSNNRRDVEIDLLCYSDTLLVFQLESSPASAITIPYSGVVATEKV